MKPEDDDIRARDIVLDLLLAAVVLVAWFALLWVIYTLYFDAE